MNKGLNKKNAVFIIILTISLYLLLIGCGSKLTEPTDVNTPENLELEKTGNTTILLNWTYLNTTNDTIEFIIAKKSGESAWKEYYGLTTQTSFVDNINTNDSLVYAYKIRAYNDTTFEYSSYSNSIAFFSSVCTPSQLKIEQTSVSQIELTWTDNSLGEEGFAIDKKIGDEAWQNNYYKTTANVNSFTDSTTLFQEFQYRVSAYFGDSYSESIKEKITPTLFAPTNLELINLDNTNIRLNWTDNNNTEDGFIIDKKIGHDDWQKNYATLNKNITTFVDDVYYPCATYSYRVKTYKYIAETDTTFYSTYSESQKVDIRLNLAGSIDTDGSSNEVFVLNPNTFERYALVADHYNGCEIIDCINPSAPSKTANLELPDRTISVYAKDNLAYATNRNGTVNVIDISDINNPEIIESCNTGGVHNDIEVAGDYAFVADGDIGVSIIIVSGPPHLITTKDVGGNAKDLSIAGNYAYISTGLNGGIVELDISDPTNPTVQSNINYNGNALGITSDSSYAYLANGEEGLEIIDISTPGSPQHVGNCPTDGYLKDVKVNSNFAYAIDSQKGLIIFDITDKTNPFILAIKALTTEASSIDLSGSYVFISDNQGLKIYQINE